jgi:Periplasmic serine proteases (ClpP class)
LVDKIGGFDDVLEVVFKFVNIEEYKVIRYFKEMEYLEIFIVEVIDSIDIKIDFGKNYKRIFNVINSGYKFMDEEKDINMISYCFECEFIKFEYE